MITCISFINHLVEHNTKMTDANLNGESRSNAQSRKYYSNHILDVDDFLEDGFYDPGRGFGELKPLKYFK